MAVVIGCAALVCVQRCLLPRATGLLADRCCALHLFPPCATTPHQVRKPLDVWGFIKSPYGLMICFMLFAIFVFPMLKVDPEEYKEAMASLRGEEPPPPTAQGRARISNR